MAATTPSPSASRADEIESAALCDRCKKRADWAVRYHEICQGGSKANEPLIYLLCDTCLRYFGEVVRRKHVDCMSCGKEMESLSHGIKEVERL